jgi:hypothetical protein
VTFALENGNGEIPGAGGLPSAVNEYVVGHRRSV